MENHNFQFVPANVLQIYMYTSSFLEATIPYEVTRAGR